MRTYSRDAWLEAQALWDDGEYGYRWGTVRKLAKDRGFIYPPTGTIHDSREADNPSQRAIIYHALEDNPGNVEAIVRRSRSWSQVVDGIFGLEAQLAAGVAERERDEAWQRKDEPDGREATMTLKAIFDRIGDS